VAQPAARAATWPVGLLSATQHSAVKALLRQAPSQTLGRQPTCWRSICYCVTTVSRINLCQASCGVSIVGDQILLLHHDCIKDLPAPRRHVVSVLLGMKIGCCVMIVSRISLCQASCSVSTGPGIRYCY